MNTIKNNAFALIIAIGLLCLGYFIYKGLKTFSDNDRFVTVKGLAEMDMKATSAQIMVNFSFTGDDLNATISKVEEKKNKILAHLKSQHPNLTDIKEMAVQINDKQAYYEDDWVDGKQVKVKVDRYTVSQSIKIYGTNVEENRTIADKTNIELIHNDITSTVSTHYNFPDLNSIKPQLIAESTKNARIAGEQFANDSDANLGKIKTASQGQITIDGTYDYEVGAINSRSSGEYIQTARVVSSIVFFLE